MGSLSFLKRAFVLPFLASLALALWMSSQKGLQWKHLLSFQVLLLPLHTKYGQTWLHCRALFVFHLIFLKFGRKLYQVCVTQLVTYSLPAAWSRAPWFRKIAGWICHLELYCRSHFRLSKTAPSRYGGLETTCRGEHAVSISPELLDEVKALRPCLGHWMWTKELPCLTAYYKHAQTFWNHKTFRF